MALVAIPRVRGNPQALFACSAVVVGGFLVNRLNVSTTGLDASSGYRYFPSWMEVAVTLSVVVVGLAIFRFAMRFLPVYPSARQEVAKEETRGAIYAQP